MTRAGKLTIHTQISRQTRCPVHHRADSTEGGRAGFFRWQGQPDSPGDATAESVNPSSRTYNISTVEELDLDHSTYTPSSDFSAVRLFCHHPTFLPSSDFSAITRLLCHHPTSLPSPDFSATTRLFCHHTYCSVDFPLIQRWPRPSHRRVRC
jgi:hypothetical protein